ncbi:M23 family metallopeptidase [Actinophytocola sp.]|uniref:M23 family metallopeptidase n=1 Tax=Actinophytocola sp. TaxID=1872138 RepID=UPI002D7E9CAF|nr:M23 family metallopeptidase [Actinophytocola sp.]
MTMWRRRNRVGLLAVTAVPVMLLVVPTPAAGARPNFQAPFPCGTAIRAESFGHAPALDIFRNPTGATEGQLLVAPAAGVVNQSYSNPAGAGNIVQINHGGGWFTTYLHLQTRLVQAGDRVQRGVGIGRVGHTGETSNGVPHVHFEMAVDRNGDGRAEWGYANNERTPPVFNGVTYGQANSQSFQITSRNCGSAKDEFGVFRPSDGSWYTPGTVLTTNWGEPGDLPFAADLNRNGIDEIGVFRPSTGNWHTVGQIVHSNWGEPGDLPVTGDWNGDGITQIGVFRPSTGDWFTPGTVLRTNWGEPGDLPVAGDWNGDGIDEPAVFRPATGDWFVLGRTLATNWGEPGDLPIAGDWNGDGIDEIGVFRPTTRTWHKPGVVMQSNWGERGDLPIAGNFN